MLVDTLNRPVRDLRISVTDRCNFRCSYCMPADVYGHDYVFLQRREILTFEEISAITAAFVQLGVRKIRLTGGEPLLRTNLRDLVAMLAQIPGIEDIALTTNGYFLESKAQALKSAGVNRLTVSLDTLNPELHRDIAGQNVELARVLRGIEQAQKAGFSPIKLNTVIKKNVNEGEILDLLRFAESNGHIIRFIEYMDVGNLNQWRMGEVVTAEKIVATIAAEMAIEPLAKSYEGEVANRYRFSEGNGEFGVIASVSQPFCGDCTRARLSADGKIFTCLFSTNGFNLKESLRSGATSTELVRIISSVWRGRSDRYSEERRSNTRQLGRPKVEMYHIGG
ncbi:GTP 3',8-cyclase MoaA [bacterium]|nr:GTP 3',8-cyclase MoaA [bacterium]